MLYQNLLIARNFLPTAFLSKNKGQGLVEYALIILLVVIVVIGALTLFGLEVDILYNNIVSRFPTIGQ